MSKRILLTILPYWDPMIPPLGIVSLKEFLQKYGYKVRTVDFIVKKEFLDFYNQYFKVLKEIVPPEKRGNFNNIGHDVLQTQMMAHQNFTNKSEYFDLIEKIIYNHYYVIAKYEEIEKIVNLTSDYYQKLEFLLSQELEDFQPDIVGFSVFKCTLPSTIFAAQIVKKINKNIQTIIGGGTFNESHAPDSPNFDILLKKTKDYIDKIIIGQGELLFLNYLKGNLIENQRVYTRDDIEKNLLTFEEQNIPDFSDLNLSSYPYMAATATAGCLYDCSFCVSKRVSPNYRIKASEQLVQEMQYLYSLHGHQLFLMTDSLINPVLNDISHEFINHNQSLYYDAYLKIDDASGSISNTLLWRKGGLYRVRIGTESGSQKILDMMDKKITPEKIKDSIISLANAGIKTTTYWVIGHPGETEADFQMTLDLIEELKDYIFQAESNYFLYHYSKQAKADEWAKDRLNLYDDKYQEMLLFNYYTLNKSPLRDETFKRVHRFEKHCRSLGIPNPYSYNDHMHADIRWHQLHKNAVPSLSDFLKKENYISENLNINIPSMLQKTRKDEVFSF